MKFSIQEEGCEKQVFLNFQEASEKTGIIKNHILKILKRDNSNYRRRPDGKRFVIKKETTPFVSIDGKVFSTIEEIETEFGLSRTMFCNQLLRKEKHFLDAFEKSHEVDWKSEEMDKCLDNLRQWRQLAKIERKTKVNGAFLRNQKGIRQSQEPGTVPLTEILLT